jgi:hypothetical protein
MRSLSQFLKSVIQHRVGLFLVVIGFMAALALQWNGPQSIAVADEIAYIISGVNLVAQGEYTNPFGKPELWFPPVYPLLIGCLSLGGSLDAFLIARLISAVAAIATLLIVYQLVVQVFQQWSDKSHRQPDSSSTKTARGYALLAIVFLASNPTFQHYGTRALSESLAACLSLSALCVWVCRTRSIKNAFVIGGLIGAATLTRPECVLVLPLWLGFELFRCRDRLAVNRSVAAGCTTLVLLLPYVLFLHSHTGRWSISNKGPVNLAAGRAAFHQSPREFINPESLVMGFYEYDTSLAVESQRYLFNASKLAASFSEIYFRWWVAALIVALIAAGWRHLCRPESVPIDSIPGDSKSKRAHAKRVCSDRFSYISAPIGAFGAQINQPLVALLPAGQYLAWAAGAQSAYLAVVCVFDVGGPKNWHLILPIVCMLLAASFHWAITERRWSWIVPATLCLAICVAEGATRYPRWTLTSSTAQEELLLQAGQALAEHNVPQGVVYENGATIGFYANQRRGRLTSNTLETITSFIRKQEQIPAFLAVSSFGSSKLDDSVMRLLQQPNNELAWQEVVRVNNGADTVAVFQLRIEDKQLASSPRL